MYWLGSAYDYATLWSVNVTGTITKKMGLFSLDQVRGVRPVIVVPTSSIQTS